MKKKQAIEYFNDGMITGFDAVRDPMVSGCWLLVISGRNGKSWTYQTALGGPRSFSKIDTLIGEIEAVSGRVSSLKVSI